MFGRKKAITFHATISKKPKGGIKSQPQVSDKFN